MAAYNPIRRGSTFHLYKRVPTRYASIEPRKTIWISLHTDSESVARTKAPVAWEHMIEGWEAGLTGDTEDAEQQFDAARDLAAARGFRFMKAEKVARLPREEVLKRMEDIPERNGEPDVVTAAAVLGTAAEPPIRVTQALELFWTLAADRALGKSEDQVRRWKNPRIKAIKNFIEVVGDKALAEITGDDMLEFRDWWIRKIAEDGLTANSANKDLVHLGDTLKTVVRLKRLGLVLPLSDLAIKDGEKRTRPPFSNEWIKTKILAPGALAGLNTEARCIILGMVNTGYRPSEGAGLLPQHIRLDGDVPHITLEPEGRQLKSAHGKRVIPLAGVSLEAFRQCPEGFPTYRFKDKISDTANKYLRENKLLETEAHTLYGLRHSFEDRMIAAGVDDRIRRDLFGHRLDREKYGNGAKLDHLLRIVQSISF